MNNMNILLDEFKKTTFIKTRARGNIAKKFKICQTIPKQKILGTTKKRSVEAIASMTLGLTIQYFKKNPPILERKNNKKFPKLYELLKKMIKEIDPDFTYNNITLNHNVECAKHKDRYNRGDSYLLFLGDYEGGELNVEDGRIFSETNKPIFFDNRRLTHWNNPIKSGNKYSIIWFWDNRVKKGIN